MIIKDKEVIKYGDEYSYLNVTITSDGKNVSELRQRLKKGKMVISHLDGILWNKQITKETKSINYNSIITCSFMWIRDMATKKH